MENSIAISKPFALNSWYAIIGVIKERKKNPNELYFNCLRSCSNLGCILCFVSPILMPHEQSIEEKRNLILKYEVLREYTVAFNFLLRRVTRRKAHKVGAWFISRSTCTESNISPLLYKGNPKLSKKPSAQRRTLRNSRPFSVSLYGLLLPCSIRSIYPLCSNLLRYVFALLYAKFASRIILVTPVLF